VLNERRDEWWLVKGFRRNQSWPNQGTTPAFALRDGTVIPIQHLLNISLQHYYWAILLTYPASVLNFTTSCTRIPPFNNFFNKHCN
jgi:hypothetical protein